MIIWHFNEKAPAKKMFLSGKGMPSKHNFVKLKFYFFNFFPQVLR